MRLYGKLFYLLALWLWVALCGLRPAFCQSGSFDQDQVQAETPLKSVDKLPATRINPKDGAEMVLIPAGRFQAGDTDRKDNPRRGLGLSAYYIYKNVVTVAMYEKFCTETKHPMPHAPPYNPNYANKNHPIVNIMWSDAKAYCDWAGTTLPTEAQWEKAARGTDGRTFPWGNTFDPAKLRFTQDVAHMTHGTSLVGSYPAGASPYGVLDMAGNVWQWCADWYDESFPGTRAGRQPDPFNDSVGTKTKKSARGGSWMDFESGFDNKGGLFHCAFRSGIRPDDWGEYIGFRCAITPQP